MFLTKSSRILKYIVECRINKRNDFKVITNSHRNQQQQQFHTNPIVLAKLFLDKENQYAHNILETSENYKLYTKIVFNKQVNEKQEDIDEILANCSKINNADKLFDDFTCVVNYCNRNEICISNEKFDEFVNIFMDNCDKLNDEQLMNSIRLLSLLPATQSAYTRNYVELWKSLDDACIQRIEKWKVDQLLLVCDCWYALNLSKSTQYVWEALRRIGRKIIKLNPQQLVHSIFICNLVRKPLAQMFDFEVNFAQCIDQLTINEIGIMSMGFFKTQTRIHNPKLIDEIYRRLMKELDTVEDITLVNILKVLRYSSRIPQAELMYELLRKLCSQIDRISLLCCLHVALLGVEIQLCEEECIKLIIERFNRDIASSRIKDMERICHVMSLFNIETENDIEKKLCQNIIELLKDREDEIMKYPRSFSACVYYLTLCGAHDKELISVALDQRFIKHVFGTNLVVGREIFLLDAFTRINLRDQYNGNLLTDKQRKAMGKRLTIYIPEKSLKRNLSLTDQILLQIKDTCHQLLHQNCYFKHVLPHFERPDIIFCYDKKKQMTIPLNTDKFPDYNGIILYRDTILGDEANEEYIESIVVIVAGWNNFVRDKDRITGLFKLKLKQLEILGHRTVVIPWNKWRELETPKDRIEFLRRKISPFL